MEDYPRTLAEFEARFATEEACRTYLVQLRWPDGFRCPTCGEGKAWPVRTRAMLFHCANSGRQSSVISGTIFQDTRTPLATWFRAMWWVTSQKTGASAMGLQRVLGLGSYETAWTWLHKFRRAMVRPGRDRLTGTVEVDETYLGGLEEGVRGRQTEKKALIAVAAEEAGRGIGHIRMRRIADASADSLQAFVEGTVAPGKSPAHRRIAQLRPAGEMWLSAPDRLPQRAQGIGSGSVASGPPCGIPAQTVAPRHTSRRRQPCAPRLLPRRVHIPFQPAHISASRETVFPAGAAGRHGRSGSIRHARQARAGRIPRPAPPAAPHVIVVT